MKAKEQKGRGIIFIDGDFPTGKECEYHCSPTCHPGQIGPDWKYGCTHKAWPSNKYGDFVPFVECGGDPAKCELQNKKFTSYYRRGKVQSLNYTKKKAERLEKEIEEIDSLTLSK